MGQVSGLVDYKVEFYSTAPYGWGTPYYTITKDTDPRTAVAASTITFKTRKIGGPESAQLRLVCGNTQTLADFSCPPNMYIVISTRFGTEGGYEPRFRGRILKSDIGHGTDPHTRTVTARGTWGDLQYYPMMRAPANKTVQQLVRDIIYAVNPYTDIASLTGMVVHSNPYSIAEVDFFETKVTDAVKYAASVAGAGTVYGVDTQGRLFFQAPSDNIVATFEVGDDNPAVLTERLTQDATQYRNGLLVKPQQKISGGNLTLFIKPDNPPYLLKTEQLPEAVGADDAYQYGVVRQAELSAIDDRATLAVGNFGQRLFEYGIMTKKIRLRLVPGGAEYDLPVDSETVTIKADGSVSSQYALGTRPKNDIYAEFGYLMSESETAKVREFWTRAELDKAGRDVIRQMRRVVANHELRSFWHSEPGAIKDTVESEDDAVNGDTLITLPDFSFMGYPDATYDWDYGQGKESIRSDRKGAIVISQAIPTGLVTKQVCAQVVEDDTRIRMATTENLVTTATGGAIGTMYGALAPFMPFGSFGKQGAWFTGETLNTWETDTVTWTLSRMHEDQVVTAVPTSVTNLCNGANNTDDGTDMKDAEFSAVHLGMGWYGTGDSDLLERTSGWAFLMMRPKGSTQVYGSFVSCFFGQYFNHDNPWVNNFITFDLGADDADPIVHETRYFKLKCTYPGPTGTGGDYLRIHIYDMKDNLLAEQIVNIEEGIFWFPGPHFGVSWHDVNRGFYSSVVNPPMRWRYLEIESDNVAPLAVSRSDGQDWVYGYSGDLLNLASTASNTNNPNLRIAAVVDIANWLHAWSVGFNHTTG